jgi:hypothetical protein
MMTKIYIHNNNFTRWQQLHLQNRRSWHYIAIILTIYCQDQYNYNNIAPTSQYNNIDSDLTILLLCPPLRFVVCYRCGALSFFVEETVGFVGLGGFERHVVVVVVVVVRGCDVRDGPSVVFGFVGWEELGGVGRSFWWTSLHGID